MPHLSDESIQEMKDLLEKKAGKKFTWEEATEVAHNLAGLAEIMYKSAVEQIKREDRLKKSPKGFMLDGVGYTCHICGASTQKDGNWYDKWGIKCLVCQKAVDKKIIPGSCAKNQENWYSTYDLESRFNINRHTLKRFIKEGILTPRIVPTDNGRVHAQIFLIKDNKDTLPPKKLTESQLVKEEKDGKEWHRSYPWYCFEKDPFETLKDYKIMNHLKLTIPTN